MVAFGALIALAIGVPVATAFYWMAQSQHSTLPAAATLGQAAHNSLVYSVLGATAAVTLALPVAMLTFRRSSAGRVLLERSTYVTLALPGVVVALSLVYFATHYAYGVYQTSLLLICAYAIMHFPLALVCIKASVAQAPARLADAGLSLGRGQVFVFSRVTLPLLAPGILAGFCLVFLTAVTELTATLLLAPIGVQTLATQFWAYESEVSYGAAAPYALAIIALAALPAALLALWFDRGRGPQLAPT
jgi:iron(III) transport system permease protein